LKSHDNFSFPPIKLSHIAITRHHHCLFSQSSTLFFQINNITFKPFKMVSFIATALSALCLALTTSAAPTEADVQAADAHTGSITYYNTGLGACGHTNNDGELVAALSQSLFDRVHPCGRKLRINYKGKSLVVTVVDSCSACAEYDVDLSPAAFRKVIGPLEIGRANAKWDWV
jgi:expansin (peptidoglycan-binding protein)